MSLLLTKARTTVRSARLLLDAGDPNGAVNRAYYGIFHAAPAALGAVDPKLLKTKSHATVIRRFGKHIVEERGFDRSLGRLFSQAEIVRIGADYEDAPVDEAAARKALESAESFVAGVEAFLDRSPT
jgi:uncharacterized protein (UPF0332 family)